ncbi:hypothetical protein GCM10009730_48680 [Streptomyces albidochromogenes]
MAPGPPVLAAYALRVARQRQGLFELRPGHDRAPPLPAKAALQEQFAQRLPHGFARDLVPYGEITLGRQESALPQLADQRGDMGFDGVVLGNAAVLRDAGADRRPRVLVLRVRVVLRVVHALDGRRRC